VLHPVDLHDNLVKAPAPMQEMPHRHDPAFAEFSSGNDAERVLL
jgi:hypothetical protein